MDIPIFKSPPVASIESPTQDAKTPAEITAQVSNEYAPGANVAQPAKPPRKPRSDIGKTRGPRGSSPNPAPGQAGVVSPNGETVGFTIDKAIVEKTAKTVLHTVDGVLVRKVGGTVMKLCNDLELAKELSANSGLTTGECDLMAELTGVIFEKHGWLTGYAPEMLLSMLLAEWGIRITLVMKRLDGIAQQQAKKNKENVSPSSPDKDGSNRQVGER